MNGTERRREIPGIPDAAGSCSVQPRLAARLGVPTCFNAGLIRLIISPGCLSQACIRFFSERRKKKHGRAQTHETKYVAVTKDLFNKEAGAAAAEEEAKLKEDLRKRKESEDKKKQDETRSVAAGK